MAPFLVGMHGKAIGIETLTIGSGRVKRLFDGGPAHTDDKKKLQHVAMTPVIYMRAVCFGGVSSLGWVFHFVKVWRVRNVAKRAHFPQMVPRQNSLGYRLCQEREWYRQSAPKRGEE